MTPLPGDAIDQPFWDGLAAGELRMQRCAACDQWTWPPQWRCGRCGSWDMIWQAVPMDGVVHSLAWVRHPFTPAMAGRTPFANLLVELPAAGGARLLGVLEGTADGIAVGTSVAGEIVQDADGQPVLRWRIKP